MVTKDILATSKIILGYIVNNDYKKLIDEDLEKSLDEEYVKDAIEEYGGHLGFPPDNTLEELLDIYETENPNRIYVDLDLWINNEKSDLTLSYVIILSDDKVNYALKDIHIL